MKKHLTASALALAALCAASPAFAQHKRPTPLAPFAADSVTIPVAVNKGGLAGATFSSYLALFNPTSSAFDVEATLYDSNGIFYRATISLAAGELKTYDNLLGTVFDFEGAGTVKLKTSSNAPNNNDLFIASSEVYTTSSGVHFGTSVPAIDFPGSDAHSFAAGITVDAQRRVNVGCYNETAAPNSIDADVYDATGTEIGSVTLELPAHGWGQKRVETEVNGGYIEFTPAAAAECYAVVVNNSTNDGRFVQAVEYAP